MSMNFFRIIFQIYIPRTFLRHFSRGTWLSQTGHAPGLSPSAVQRMPEAVPHGLLRQASPPNSGGKSPAAKGVGAQKTVGITRRGALGVPAGGGPASTLLLPKGPRTEGYPAAAPRQSGRRPPPRRRFT